MADIKNFQVADIILEAQQNALPSRALWKGTVFLRSQGDLYLNKSLFEDTPKGNKAYLKRLSTAVLKPNKYKSTVNYIQGQLFGKPLMLDYENVSRNDVKTFFDSFIEDVDNKGDDWNVFLKTSLKNGLIDGISFVMIDTPSFERVGKQIKINGKILPNTKDTMKKENIRPYWVQIELKDVIDVKVSWAENGKKEYTRFVYKETIAEDKNTTKVRIYEYTKEDINIYTQDTNGNATLESHITNNFGFIPVSLFICGEPTSDYTALPTLTDLAQLQIAHYNAYSEHQQLMRYDRNPLWLSKDLEALDENGNKIEVVLGPGAGISGGPEADLKSVGVDSQSVVQSFQDLEELEKSMDEYTTALFTNQNMTAEQVSLISGSSDSQIKNWATMFKDFIEDLLCNTAIIGGYNNEEEINYPQVVVNNEFRKPFDYQLATLTQDMVMNRQLSLKSFLKILKSMSLEIDVDEELKELGQASSNNFEEPPKE